jgi:NAD(P)-dependent dehydrogenase (short-subunit alcohol dehydrogenase family)
MRRLAVNTLAPYMLTELIGRPARLIYLSSGLHHVGGGSLRDIDWTGWPWTAALAYSESKLQVTAFALTLARAWPEVLSNAVDPGWVPTKVGGAAATGDLQMGYLTQTWLAVSTDAAATVSGANRHRTGRQAARAHSKRLAARRPRPPPRGAAGVRRGRTPGIAAGGIAGAGEPGDPLAADHPGPPRDDRSGPRRAGGAR